jgi:hypothetical protein
MSFVISSAFVQSFVVWQNKKAMDLKVSCKMYQSSADLQALRHSPGERFFICHTVEVLGYLAIFSGLKITVITL